MFTSAETMGPAQLELFRSLQMWHVNLTFILTALIILQLEFVELMLLVCRLL